MNEPRDDALARLLRKADLPSAPSDLLARAQRRIRASRRRAVGSVLASLALAALGGAAWLATHPLPTPSAATTLPPSAVSPHLADLGPLADRPPVDSLHIVRMQQDETLAVLKQWAEENH